MGNLFGKKSKHVSKVTEQDKAVLQLKQQRDKLRLYQKSIENTLEKDKLLAKKLVSEGKKERALLLLRKKRYQETLLSNTDKQLHNLEQLTSDIEFAQVETQVIDGLRVGSKALTELNAAMNIEEVEKIMEDTKEAYDKQEEINALLNGVLTSEDEESVLEELDILLNSEVAELPVESAEVYSDEEENENLQLPDVPEAGIQKPPKAKQPVRTAVLES